MPEPKVGDILRWQGQVIEVIELEYVNAPQRLGFMYEGRGRLLGVYSGSDGYEYYYTRIGSELSIVFSDETVEESGWIYEEDEFDRAVREIRRDHAQTRTEDIQEG